MQPLLVDRSGLARMLGCERKKTYKLQDLDAGFPRPARDAAGTAMWRVDEVHSYIENLWSKYVE